MEEIVAYLIGAALLTAWVVGGAKKIIKRFRPKSNLDPWTVTTITALANFGIGFLTFGDRYPWWTILLAAGMVASGAKIGYDATRGLERTHSGGE